MQVRCSDDFPFDPEGAWDALLGRNGPSREESMSTTVSTLKLSTALKIVDSIEKQAAKSEDPHVKRILLASGCQIIDHILKQHQKVA